MRRHLSRITAALLAFCLLLSGCAASPGTSQPVPEAEDPTVSSSDTLTAPPQEDTQEEDSLPSDGAPDAPPAEDVEDAAAEAETAGEEPLATLLLASDYQEKEGWPAPAETLRALLATVQAEGFAPPDNAIFCGDYTNEEGLYHYETSPDASIAEITALVTEAFPGCPAEDLIFVQGNHDQMSESISAGGLHEYESYLVYVINTQTGFPWKQGTLGLDALVENTASQLEDCLDGLIAAGETRPVLIAGHVPLHFSGRTSSLHSTGDNLYASALFDVVNRAGESLDCIYLFGHNHSKGWDSYLGGSAAYLTRGDRILIPDSTGGGVNTDRYTVQTLQFTYLNPGYLGYVSDSGADSALTCTVCEIYRDEIVFTRCDTGGVHPMRSAGAANPYRDDTALIPQEEYVTPLESPQVIRRNRPAAAQ